MTGCMSAMTSRELVYATLDFKNITGIAPRDLWTLPWAEMNHGEALKQIQQDFPPDIIFLPDEYKLYKEPLNTKGNPFEVGSYTDEWGVVWQNAGKGHIGEVKEPIIAGENGWDDTSRINIPEALLTFDTKAVNEYCEKTDKFVVMTDLARPFERIQFIRGSESLFVDLALDDPKMLAMLEKIHDFNCRLFERWGQTKVDALFAMDDWGTQRSLLINPEKWKQVFKPMYRDYSDIAHKHGKRLFFHSDGNTLAIIPELIDIGFDAVNLQIFAIGVEKLAQFRGEITFWGEMDRQHLLPRGTPEDIADAVKLVRDMVWQDGGAIAQLEFGPGANPDNIRQYFASWMAYGT